MKNNQKCVRMSDDVLAYIEKFPGDGFNQKFENAVLYFKKTEPEYKKRLAQLEKDIQARQAAIQRQSQKMTAVSEIGRYLDALRMDAETLHARAQQMAE